MLDSMIDNIIDKNRTTAVLVGFQVAISESPLQLLYSMYRMYERLTLSYGG